MMDVTNGMVMNDDEKSLESIPINANSSIMPTMTMDTIMEESGSEESLKTGDDSYEEFFQYFGVDVKDTRSGDKKKSSVRDTRTGGGGESINNRSKVSSMDAVMDCNDSTDTISTHFSDVSAITMHDREDVYYLSKQPSGCLQRVVERTLIPFAQIMDLAIKVAKRKLRSRRNVWMLSVVVVMAVFLSNKQQLERRLGELLPVGLWREKRTLETVSLKVFMEDAERMQARETENVVESSSMLRRSQHP